jgi:N6-adenosine-specific RNA methylase IME4
LIKYSIIYSDPPWQYQNYNYATTKDGTKAKRGIVKEYPVMTVQDIKNLPVKDISNDNSILFLWVTFPLLEEGLDVIKAWGFKYKTIGFNWVKRNKNKDSWFWGMGNWTRSNSELCLIGVRGKPKKISSRIHSIIDTPIEKHSKKPDIVRDKIIELCGNLPRIELLDKKPMAGLR